eukprot:COSAG02_NODE_25540_length_655_cov_2.170863_1_plen_31_part_10
MAKQKAHLKARKAAVQKTPFVDFLTCESFQN